MDSRPKFGRVYILFPGCRLLKQMDDEKADEDVLTKQTKLTDLGIAHANFNVEFTFPYQHNNTLSKYSQITSIPYPKEATDQN